MIILFKKLLHKLNFFFGSHIYPILFYYLPVNNNKFVFSSYYGKEYSGNPKAISELLHNTDPGYEIVWLLSKHKMQSTNIPDYVKIVPYNSLKAAYELSTAKVWIDNIRKSMIYFKKENQIYIQTWHGTPLKKIEKDAGNKISNKYHRLAKRDSMNIDFLISGSGYTTRSLRSSFWYNGEILEYGTPRNDIFFSENETQTKKVRDYFSLDKKKIILYAPTFRNNYTQNGISQLEKLNPKVILEQFNKKYSNECVLLYRFHPSVSKINNKEDIKAMYGYNVIDASDYPDMQELLFATDALITDYSSSFFDFSLLKRPIFLFMYDYEEYICERGLYLKINELPFYIARTSQELANTIDKMQLVDAEANCIKFLKDVENVEDGQASARIVQLIVNKIL